MKIDQSPMNSQPFLVKTMGQDKEKEELTKEVGKKSSSSPGVNLNLSKVSEDFQVAKDLVVKDLSLSQEEKVMRLQKLIDSGEYNIDEEAVAESLVKEHLLMRDE